MNLVFFGSGHFGVPTLHRLGEVHRIAGVVTQPDRPAGRGSRVSPTPIAAFARDHLPDTRILRVERVNDAAGEIREIGADAWVVIAFGQKLGRTLLNGVFAVNLHASLLPRWRGAAPVNAAILAGDAETGNTVITLAERMDAGMILGQSRRAVDPLVTAGELHDLLAADGPALVESVLNAHIGGRLRPQEQDEARATRAPKLSRTDGWVDFGQSAEECRRRVHGLTPWPGVAVMFRDEPLKLLRVKPLASDRESAEAGTIVDADAGHVSCRDGILALLEVQPAGGRRMAWADFARGRRISPGDRLYGRSAPA